MPEREPVLMLKLEGGPAQTNRVPVDALTEMLKKVQLCIKRIGLVLTGQSSSAKPGRITGAVETACALDVVAIAPGSFCLTMDISTSQGPEEKLWGTEQPLGYMAIDKFMDGLNLLDQPDPRLINEFDYGVLYAVRDVSKILQRGIQTIEFHSRFNGSGGKTAYLNPRVKMNVIQNITGPLKTAVEVKGSLREVDLERHSCQIFPSTGRFIQCSFKEHHEQLMKELLDCYVVATGEAILREADGHIKELQIEDVEMIDESAESFQEEPLQKPVTGRDLLVALRESGLVGLWKDRTDIGDSSEYARQLRELAQQRTRE